MLTDTAQLVKITQRVFKFRIFIFKSVGQSVRENVGHIFNICRLIQIAASYVRLSKDDATCTMGTLKMRDTYKCTKVEDRDNHLILRNNT